VHLQYLVSWKGGEVHQDETTKPPEVATMEMCLKGVVRASEISLKCLASSEVSRRHHPPKHQEDKEVMC
jgi:hypothetical protein